MDEFEAEVRHLMEEDSLTFVRAVWAVMDDLTDATFRSQEGGNPLACRSGCSFCCYQPVTATAIEWEEIKRYLRSLPRLERREILARARPWVIAWRKYHEEKAPHAPRRPSSPAADQIRLHLDWRGKPCPFLSKQGACSIYPVRPMDCRTMTSTVTCTIWDGQEGIKRFRFPWEFWGNQMILEEQERKGGRMEVTPLLHWLHLLDAEKK